MPVARGYRLEAVKLLRAASLVVLAAVLLPAAHAAPAPIRVQGIERIGAFRVEGAHLKDARRVFGKPTSMRQERGGCTLSWPGLKLRFYTLLHDRQCREDSAFESAEISGPWATDRGLRRGDTVSRARSLYPGAKRVDRAFGVPALGLVIKSSEAIGDYGLAAALRGGRLTTLLLLDPQGGE